MISIIVPVYNVAEYIKECIESILSQTYTDIELILVDDGSTDGSREICERYSESDERVVVVSQSHKGAAAARKAAFNVSRGQWIGFVDSDDWIRSEMYEMMYNEANKSGADMVMAGHVAVFPQKSEKWINDIPKGFYYRDQIVRDIFPKLKPESYTQKWIVGTACWDKIFKRDLLEKTLYEVKDIIWDGDDIAFVYPSIVISNGISVLDETLYYHRIRTDSLSSAYDDSVFERLGALFHVLKKSYSKSGYWDVLKKPLGYQMRWFLVRHVVLELGTDIYEENNTIPPYVFPFSKVLRGQRIILYGSGKVGQTFYRQLKKTNYCDVVLWVSKEGDSKNMGIKLPATIRNVDYDIVIVAVESPLVADEIKNELMSLGVHRDKVVWENPVC